MQTQENLRLTELLFNLLVIRLFKKYSEPVKVFKFLESCCTMFGIELLAFEKLLVKDMQQYYNEDRLLNETLYLLYSAGVDRDYILQVSGLPRSTTYWRIKQFKQRGTVKRPAHTAEDLELMRLFVRDFLALGELI